MQELHSNVKKKKSATVPTSIVKLLLIEIIKFTVQPEYEKNGDLIHSTEDHGWFSSSKKLFI